MILDTTFLIDLHREIIRRQTGSVAAFLSKVATSTAAISVISMGEFLGGMHLAQFPYGVSFIERFELLLIDRSVALEYAQLSRSLRATGQRIGDNDLWIAATALAHGQPLVTRNQKDFARIPHLNVLAY